MIDKIKISTVTFCFGLLILFFSQSAFAKLYIHQMKHLRAEQAIPTIKPHVDPSTQLSAKDYKLFIEADEKNYAKIMQILEMLDKARENILVEVRVLDRKLDTWEQKGATLKVSGNSVSGQVKSYRTKGKETVDQTYRLNTLEGQQGYISTGIAFPTKQIVAHYGSFVPKTQYKEAKSGFFVAANKLPNGQYQVNINSQQANRKGKGGKTIQSTSAGQNFKANPNEWIMIASTEAGADSTSNKNYRVSDKRSHKKWFYLRIVEPIQ